MRQLVGRAPVSDLFGVKGREWLAALELAVEERETVDGCMRQIEFLDTEIAEVERLIASEALHCPEIKRLMSVPGVNVIVAASFLAAIGDISRFENPRASSLATSVWIRGCASPGPVRRPTATSQSRARCERVTRAGRGMLDRGQTARAAACVLPESPCPGHRTLTRPGSEQQPSSTIFMPRAAGSQSRGHLRASIRSGRDAGATSGGCWG